MRGLKSTIIGSIFILIGLGLFIYSFFVLDKEIERMSFEAWFIGGFVIVGIVSVKGKDKWIDKVVNHYFPGKNKTNG